MTAEQILQCIQAPEKLNMETLPFLKELTAQHPAFEAGWILYLKNLKNLNDSTFGQELINGAIRIQDRRRLYLFLNKKNNGKEPEQTASSETDLDLFNLIFAPEYQLEAPEEAETSNDENARSIQNESEKKFKLIDRFLEAQPKMPQIKSEETSSPMERQHENQEENDDLVTETLAMIYAKQGYNRKAIQIFEKLSLKYPEKSTYFAAQIEKIKLLMNN
jgi:hypothetical protein